MRRTSLPSVCPPSVCPSVRLSVCPPRHVPDESRADGRQNYHAIRAPVAPYPCTDLPCPTDAPAQRSFQSGLNGYVGGGKQKHPPARRWCPTASVAVPCFYTGLRQPRRRLPHRQGINRQNIVTFHRCTVYQLVLTTYYIVVWTKGQNKDGAFEDKINFDILFWAAFTLQLFYID